MLSAVLDLLFPSHCHFCRAPLGAGEIAYLCRIHAARLLPQENADPNLLCLYRYEGDLPSLIQAFKYGKKRFLIRCFEDLLKIFLEKNRLEVDGVVASPMHLRKEKERGFNQAQLLAESIARILQLPLMKNILEKGNEGAAAQAALAREARWRNVRGAIVAGKRGSSAAGKRVLLVDDVVTTGATAAECARVLRALGARSVTVLALARTPLDLVNSPN